MFFDSYYDGKHLPFCRRIVYNNQYHNVDKHPTLV